MAVLMMIMHHLWGFPERIPNLVLAGWEVQLGSAAKICVSIFMFLGGYGLYYTFRNKGTIHLRQRIWNVYKRFWQVFLIFVPIGFLFLSKPFAIQEFLQNLLCLKCSYNHEWWFLGTYMELLLVLPVVLLAEKKKSFPYTIVVSAIILRGLSHFVEINSGGVNLHLYNFCYYYPSFFLGLLFCKYSLFEKFRFATVKEVVCVVACIVLTGLAFFIRKKWDITEMTILMTPLFIYLFVVFFRMIGCVNNVFVFFGKHSMNMWLVHTFFCYYYFQRELLMVSNNAVVVYMLLVVVSLVTSVMVDWGWKELSKIMYRTFVFY